MGSRRALTDIRNLVGAAPYPCAIAKKPMLHDSDIDMGETENKEMNQDELLMDIDSADSGTRLQQQNMLISFTNSIEKMRPFSEEERCVSTPLVFTCNGQDGRLPGAQGLVATAAAAFDSVESCSMEGSEGHGSYIFPMLHKEVKGMNSKFEETNALLRAMLKLQKD